MKTFDSVARGAISAPSRLALWQRIFGEFRVRTLTEVGVWKGEYAEHMLQALPDIDTYTMIDPWRTLPGWNKPANWKQELFDGVYSEAMARTAFAESKRIVLRDRTVEASHQIKDGSQDAVYVDGDHTLRGIAIDLIRMLPKVRAGGLLCGDDFTRTIWQHSDKYDPTMIFPYAVYFAEANDLPIYSLPFDQFIIHNQPGGFKFVDLAGGYAGLSMLDVMRKPRKSVRERIRALVGRAVAPR